MLNVNGGGGGVRAKPFININSSSNNNYLSTSHQHIVTAPSSPRMGKRRYSEVTLYNAFKTSKSVSTTRTHPLPGRPAKHRLARTAS